MTEQKLFVSNREEQNSAEAYRALGEVAVSTKLKVWHLCASEVVDAAETARNCHFRVKRFF